MDSSADNGTCNSFPILLFCCTQTTLAFYSQLFLYSLILSIGCCQLSVVGFSRYSVIRSFSFLLLLLLLAAGKFSSVWLSLASVAIRALWTTRKPVDFYSMSRYKVIVYNNDSNREKKRKLLRFRESIIRGLLQFWWRSKFWRLPAAPAIGRISETPFC